LLFVGDDWAEDHHDIEVQDQTGRRLAKARLAEGLAGAAQFHELVAHHLGDDQADHVVIGIETDRGPWVIALIAAGYRVFAINPLQVARYRERQSVSGAKSDAADAHTLADMCAPTPTSCAPSPVTATRPKQSRWWLVPTRR
jgi:transposase